MSDQRLVFVGPGRVEVEAFDAGRPGPGELELLTVLSGVSAGTESLLWHGLWPAEMALDAVWSPEPGTAAYPVSFGYAAVSRVGAVGPGVDDSLRGRLVFSFTPHQSRAVVSASSVVLLQEGLDPEDAVYLASMETALCLAQDAAPAVGETVGIWGLGTMGVLTAAVLSGPFDLAAWDRSADRRDRAAAVGVATRRPTVGSCDVAVELTGQPEALNEALSCVRFSGRVVAGSWYGAQPVPLALGGDFHRSRIELVSSQVSTISPRLSGRWTKERRLNEAVRWLERLRPHRLTSHRFPLEDAERAYRQACDHQEPGLQVVFTY